MVAHPLIGMERVVIALAWDDDVQSASSVQDRLSEELVGARCEGADTDQIDLVNTQQVCDSLSDMRSRRYRNVLMAGDTDDRHSKPCSAMAR